LFIWRARQNPYLLVGWFWFLGTLVPTIGLVQVGSQSMADRYMYIPSIGLFILVVWGVDDFLNWRPAGGELRRWSGAWHWRVVWWRLEFTESLAEQHKTLPACH